MHNSIRNNLTKDDIISDIKLTAAADVVKEHTFLLVEGMDDIKFWKGMINEKVILYESYSGKGGIKDMIKEYFNDNPQVIGVRDKDYENEIGHDRIFYYDYCCMEMMFIYNKATFQRIYNEYYNGNMAVEELKEKLLSQLKFVSYIRKLNEIEKWNIKIEGISFNIAFNKEKKELVIDKLIEKLNQMNNNFFVIESEKKEMLYQISKDILSVEELLDITQGHDFLKLFSIYCAKNKGVSFSDVHISSSLRCSYGKKDFEKTKLYISLLQYEQKSTRKIIS